MDVGGNCCYAYVPSFQQDNLTLLSVLSVCTLMERREVDHRTMTPEHLLH